MLQIGPNGRKTKGKSRYVHSAASDKLATTNALHMNLLLLLSSLLPHLLVYAANARAEKLQAGACESLLLGAAVSGSSGGAPTMAPTLSSYCQCNDDSFGSHDEVSRDENGTGLSFISQLECWPPNLGKFAADFEVALRNRIDAKNGQLKIDYLHISTNLSAPTRQVDSIIKSMALSNHGKQAKSNFRDITAQDGRIINNKFDDNNRTSSSIALNGKDEINDQQPVSVSVALIDHLAIQLTGSRRWRNSDDCNQKRDRASRYVPSCSLGRQLIDLSRLINETHLQFLSIFLANANDNNINDDNNADQPLATPISKLPDADLQLDLNNSIDHRIGQAEASKHEQVQNVGKSKININNQADDYDYELVGWLKKFNNLIRLELNGFTNQVGDLVVPALPRPISLLANLSPKLKWLSLARNSFARGHLNRARDDAVAATNNNNNNNNNKSRSFPGDDRLFTLDSGETSNERHKVAESSKFELPAELEFLSLEACKLEQFQVVDMLRAASNDQSVQKNLGHSGITSLNLASNKLAHLELDFFHGLELVPAAAAAAANKIPTPNSIEQTLPFCARIAQHQHRDQKQQIGNHWFQLNSLIQLDLSQNILEDFSEKAGQKLLCIAPNLSQLYLNQNKLVHLRLYSFLLHRSAYGRLFASKLEHLDLSSNELALISSTAPPIPMTNFSSSPNVALQLKSINLSQNKLTHRPHINQLAQTLINLFDNDDDNLLNLFALFEPQVIDDARNNTHSQGQSFCDLFYSSNSQDQDDGSQNELSLARNNLQFIGHTEFGSLKCRYVRILRLNQNNINSIDQDAFSQLSQLELLDLSANELELLPEKLFSKTSSLKAINLRSNRLLSIPKLFFSNLRFLEEIRLDDNELMQLPSGIFEQNLALTIINLSSNRLVSSLDELIFGHLHHLEQLKLDGNQLNSFNILISHKVSIPTQNPTLINSTFRNQQNNPYAVKSKHPNGRPINNRKHSSQKSEQKKRRHNRRQLTSDESNQANQDFVEPQSDLILSSNQLTSFGTSNGIGRENNNQLLINRNCPRFLLSLRSLMLNDNRLRQLNSSAFQCVTNVIQIYLQKNLLVTLSPETFSKLTHLEHLDLSSNLLTRFEPNLKQLPNLKYFSLQSNRLERISLSEIFGLGKPTKKYIASETSINNDPQTRETLVALESIDLSFNPRLSIELGDFSAFLRQSQLIRKIELRAIARLWLDSNSNSSIMSLNEKVQFELVDLGGIDSIHELLLGLLSNHLVSIEKLDLSNFQEEMQDSSATSSSNDHLMHSDGGVAKSIKMASFISSSLQHDLSSLNVSNNMAAWKSFLEVLKTEQNNDAIMRYQLSHLEARQVKLSEWPFDGQLSKMLANLIDLDLSFNNLQHMFDRRFQQTNSGHLFGKLRGLNLSFNSITNLVNGESTWVDRNGLKLKDFMPNLESINLSHNNIRWLSAGFFESMTNLKLVKLDHNQLEMIPNLDSNSHGRSLIIDLTFNQNIWKSIEEQKNNIHHGHDMMIETMHEKFAHCLLSTHKFHMENPARNKERAPRDFAVSDPMQSEARSQFPELINDNSARSIGSSSLDSDEAYANRCHDFFNSIDFLKLDHTIVEGDHSNNGELFLNWATNQPFALSLEGLKLVRLPFNSQSMELIVKLSVGFNELEHVLGQEFCKLYPNLMSLEMHNNKLGKSEINLSNCTKLSYLDLSFNELTSDLLFGKNYLGSSESLQLLRLRHNELNYLTRNMIFSFKQQFPSLRFIDLRDNKLVTQSSVLQVVQFQPRLTIRLQSDPHENGCHVISLSQANNFAANDNNNRPVNGRPKLMVSHSSLSVYLRPTTMVLEATSEAANNATSLIDMRFNVHNELRFCTISSLISAGNVNKLCLVSDLVELAQSKQRDCVTFNLPSGIKSCMTNLDEQNFASQSTPRSLSTMELNTSAHKTSLTSSNVADDFNNNLVNTIYQQQQQPPDIVINSIDALKSAWIRVKRFDLNQYLTVLSNVQPDNVLTIWDGQPVYTLTVLRICVLAGAIIIVALLIAIFFLLTSNTTKSNSDKRTNKQNSCSKKSHNSSSSESPTTESHCFSTSATSACSSNSTIMSQATRSITHQTNTNNSMSNTSKHHQSATSSGHSDLLQSRAASSHSGSGKRINISATESSGNASSHNQQLVTQINMHSNNSKNDLDLNRYQILDPNQFMGNNCSTPNSSLAPSSVETVETLQAIDSIQSSLMNPSTHEQVSSIDQYNDNKNNIYTNQKGHQQANTSNLDCPVATVMRMVKSNSSNTFQNNNNGISSLNPRNNVQPIPFNSSIYNTLNQANYSALKNKMRLQSTNPPTIYEINPSYNNSINTPSNTNYAINNDRQNAQLPPEHLNHTDSTTLSLQSLNTTLAATIANSSNQSWRPSAQHEQQNFCQYHEHEQQQHHRNLPNIPQSQSNYNINQYQRGQQQQQQMTFDDFAFDIISDINGNTS